MPDSHATDVRPVPAAQELQAALALGLAVLVAHRGFGARTLDIGPALGDIELPPADDEQPDASLLAPLGPLYLAHELLAAGLLRTAERVAGLFASGAIQQPLGEAGADIAVFWQERRRRLSADEQQHLLAPIFGDGAFEAALQAVCDGLVALADNRGFDGRPLDDVREDVRLQQAAADLRQLLARHAGGMAAYAAHGIVESLQQAARFLGRRTLQAAFGVTDLWGLLAAGGDVPAARLRSHVERGRAGAVVVGWVAAADASTPVQVHGEPGRTLLAAAERWLLARERRAAPKVAA